MRFSIVHTTRYRYALPASLCHNEAHLRPRDGCGQVCEYSRLVVEPTPAVLHERVDHFGNAVTYFAVQEPHRALTVTVTSRVAVDRAETLPNTAASLPWELLVERVREDHGPADGGDDAREFALESPMAPTTAELAAFAAPSFAPGRPVLEGVHELTRRIYSEFAYDPNFTTVATPVTEVLAQRRGVCQDFAHLAIACLRSLGLPARYVSGYIETNTAPGVGGLRGADASHAWFSVYEPTLGWIDFDPTNNQVVGRRHVTVAWGRDYGDVTPLKGVMFAGGAHRLEVAVQMTREEG